MKHQPKPLIEEHYHIQELIDAQEKRAFDRNWHRDQDKLREERAALIADSKQFDLKEFYCKPCGVDFNQPAHKHVEIDWTNPNQSIAFYRAKHTCGAWCMRFVTDRFRDPYWTHSKKVAQDRGKHYKDLIQPFENGYNLLYGKS